MKKLNNPPQEIYDFIVSFIEDNSIPPTVREICAAVGLASTSTVHAHLKTLEKRGMIQRDPAKQRSIVLTAAQNSGSLTVPVVGNVAAGLPILALENIEEEFAIPSQWLHGAKKGEVFILTVEGSSMIDIGMFNGDYIIVHNGLQVNNGDIVVARIYGERATVKRFYEERDQQRVRLQPENETMQPIYVAYNDIEIVGKVIGLVRSY
ncbi:transcriptional repressor LexA [Eubacteriales bacterium OttesenSCG-928-K08]|nr:transcriptional repressor LexA [Eubacteriales bacterium OttesenSCG-928-K08]